LCTIGRQGVFRLGGWSPHVQTGFHVPRPTQGSNRTLRLRDYHPLWRTFPDPSASFCLTTGLLRFRSPLLTESRLMSFPLGTEMFQFPRFASRPYEFRPGYPSRGGFPHSDIRGSTIARISPRLFAACHVLHRLLAPRHPPDALVTLGTSQTTTRPAQHPATARTQDQIADPRKTQGQKDPSLRPVTFHSARLCRGDHRNTTYLPTNILSVLRYQPFPSSHVKEQTARQDPEGSHAER
jgi:hypothetical protein